MKAVYIYLCNKKYCTKEACEKNPDCTHTMVEKFAKNKKGTRVFEYHNFDGIPYYIEVEKEK